MVDKTIKIERTPAGTATMSAGGGSFTSTYLAQTILKHTPDGYILKPAGFIKRSGHLACSIEQAIIPVEVKDVIIIMSGTLPITDDNPDAKIEAWQITDIDLVTARTKQIPITHLEVPINVITGAGTYHNRNGAYFCDNLMIDPMED
jgi:hypothetical protein